MLSESTDWPGPALAAAMAYIHTWWNVDSVKRVEGEESVEGLEEFKQPAGDNSSCGICVAAAALSLVANLSLDDLGPPDPQDAWIPKMRAFIGAGIVDSCLPLM